MFSPFGWMDNVQNKKSTSVSKRKVTEDTSTMFFTVVNYAMTYFAFQFTMSIANFGSMSDAGCLVRWYVAFDAPTSKESFYALLLTWRSGANFEKPLASWKFEHTTELMVREQYSLLQERHLDVKSWFKL